MIAGAAGGGLLLLALGAGISAGVKTGGSIQACACIFFATLLIGLFVAVPIMGIVFLSRTLANSAEQNEKTLYERFAKQLHGRVSVNQRFHMRDFYAIEFPHRGWRALIDSKHFRKGDRSYHFACFWLELPQPTNVQCRMTPEHIADLGKWLGGQDVVFGWPVFDNAFRVTTSNESLLRHVFDGELQRRMLQLKDFARKIHPNTLEGGRAYLEIHPQLIKIRLQGVISREDEIFEFHRLCGEFMDYLVPRLR